MKIEEIYVKELGRQFIDEKSIDELEFFYINQLDIYQIRFIKTKKPFKEYNGINVLCVKYYKD
jgi:hypothetical protein